jgi:hypothetical protein
MRTNGWFVRNNVRRLTEGNEMNAILMFALAVVGQRNVEPYWMARQRYEDQQALIQLRRIQNEQKLEEDERKRKEELDPEFQKQKAAMAKSRQDDALAAKREKICAAELVTVEKAIQDMGKSIKSLSDSNEFNKSQARKGIERNAAKMMSSIVKLRENGMPSATLGKLKVRAEESINQGKSALAKEAQ